jgi:hypothetical protein
LLAAYARLSAKHRLVAQIILPAGRLLLAEFGTLLDHLLIADPALSLIELALLRSKPGGLLLINEPLTLECAALSEISLIQRALLIEPAPPIKGAALQCWVGLPRPRQTWLRHGGPRRRGLER